MTRRLRALLLALATVPCSPAALAQNPDPASLRVVRSAGTSIRLTWTGAASTTYCVFRDVAPPPATLVSEVAGLSLVDDPVAPPASPFVHYYDVLESPPGGCGGTPACNPAGALACATPFDAGTGDAQATDALDAYPCLGGDRAGRERVMRFTAAASGQVLVDLAGGPGLGVAVLLDGGAGCDPATCVAGGGTGMTFDAIAGTDYLVVVDGAPGSEAAFTVTLACPSTAGPCAPSGPLSCGDSLVARTDGSGSSDVVDTYGGCSATGYGGRERVYGYTATQDDTLGLRLSGGASALDLIVLRDDGGGCEPSATCLALEDSQATVPVSAGTTYYVIVDGPDGSEGAFQLEVACGTAQCASLGPVTCGALRQDNNSNSGVSVVDAYACTATDESGPEYVYEFIAAQTGDMTIALTGMTADLDILVMQDVLGCQGDSCIAFGDTAVTFPITAGTRYFVAIDGRNGAVSNYTVTFTCNVPPAPCEPATTIACADAIFANNGGFGSTDRIDAWPACSSWDASGPEYVAQFIAPDDVTAIASLSLTTEDLDVYVLESAGNGCDPAGCIAAGDEFVQWDAIGGRLYFVVVEGRAGARSDFRLYMDCLPAPGACLPAGTLTCGSIVSGNNGQPGSTDSVDGWPGCTPFPEDGPEVAYTHVAAASGTVDVALSGLTAELDLFVVRDDGSGCSSAGCLVAGNDALSFAAVAGETYHVVVDGRGGAIGDYTLTLTCR